jgi:hypothetical protein
MQEGECSMNKIGIVAMFFCCGAALWLSCGENENEDGGQMDTSVIGYWEGRIEALPTFGFDGARIFTRISGWDSSFTLISLTLDTANNIQDTTLDMAGRWRMNVPEDSILLLPDTCRIIDTTLNILVPKNVTGVVIPLPVDIKRNSSTAIIEWTVSFADLVPMAPLLGIDLSGIPLIALVGQKITLFKRSQQ